MTCCKPSPTRTSAAILLAALTLLGACRLPKRPVTETEALDLAKKVQTSIELQDNSVLDSVFDDKLFATKVVGDVHQDFNLLLAKKASASIRALNIGTVLLPVIKEGGTFQLLHHYEKDGHQHLLFRVTTAGADINYFDFELGRGRHGIYADDAYSYASGDAISKTFEDSVLESDKRAAMSDNDRLDFDAFREARQFLRGANPEQAYTYYLQASDKARKQLNFQKLHVEIARKLGDSATQAALEEFTTNFPQDPSGWLLLFKFYVFAKASAESPERKARPALDALNTFDKLLPNDPFLDYYRGMIYRVLHQPHESREAFRRVHAAFPRIGNIVLQLMDNYVAAHQSDSAAMLIQEAVRIRNITDDQLDNIKKIYPTIVPYLKSGQVTAPPKQEVIPPSGS